MNNTTDTNQASELHELCKKVYELTEWNGTRDWIREDGLIVDYNVWETSTPLYTSDYLLEKLPHYLEYWAGGNEAGYLTVIKGARDYRAGYFAQNVEPYIAFESEWTSTPLKALLKLTIALSEAGELK